MELVGKITLWLSLIPIYLIPLYIIVRIPFTFTPIFARYISEEKILWYKGMNKNRFILIVILSLIILFLAFTLKSDINQKSGNPYIATFAVGLTQVFLLYLIEKKISYSLKEALKTWYRMLKTDASSSYEVAESNENANLSIRNELPFKLRRYFNKEEIQFEEIQNKFGIHPDSKQDVERLLNGQLPQSPIVFTENYTRYINKRKVIDFFLTYFELYDYKYDRWNPPLSDIKRFQEKHTVFRCANRDYKDLNGRIETSDNRWKEYLEKLEI